MISSGHELHLSGIISNCMPILHSSIMIDTTMAFVYSVTKQFVILEIPVQTLVIYPKAERVERRRRRRVLRRRERKKTRWEALEIPRFASSISPFLRLLFPRP